MELRASQRTGSRVSGVVFKIGDTIANRYRVSDIIGTGGAGVVYRAHDQEIDVDVALKVVNAKLVQTADEQRLFSRQTKIARKLSHQNLVRIYDEGRAEDRPFYTMQFLEGLSLRKIIDLRSEKQQTFALAEVEPIFNQLCQALDYAHKTTFHGNLKPDNVIVLPDLLKVTDFALLRGLPRKPFLAIQKSRAQNFRYLAPEVRLEVNELDRQVDMYSLGVILCEMLTGLVYDDAKPEQLSVNGTGVDTAIVGIIKRAVARAPKDRYASASELYEDLRAVAAKGGTARSSVRVPPSSGEPPHLAEMPTQRLDISKHGPRPVAEPTEDVQRPSASEASEAPRAAVEVAREVAVPDAPGLKRHEEGSGTFAPIDDDMIESASSSSIEVRAEGALGPRPSPPFGREAAIDRAKAERGSDDDEGATEALLTSEVERRMSAPAPVVPELLEISSSEIELIADPRATNLITIDAQGGAQYRTKLVAERTAAEPEDLPSSINRTLQPTPLSDSALPQPVFSLGGGPRDETAYGRLDVPSAAEPTAAAPELSPAPEPEAAAPSDGAGRVEDGAESAGSPGARSIPRSPTLAMDSPDEPPRPAAGKAKPRPMTRPRMSTITGASVAPVGSPPSEKPAPFAALTGGAAAVASSGAASARPLLLDGTPVRGAQPSGIASALPVPPLADAPPAPNAPNRTMIGTIAVAVAVVVAAMFFLFKLQSDQQAQRIAELQQKMSELQGQAVAAKEKEDKALEEAKARGAAADEAGKNEAEAAQRANEAEQKRAAAEAEAKKHEADEKRLRDEAASAADAAKRAERQKAAEVAAAEAAQKRAAAEEEAKREREERARAEAERKRRESEELAKRLAEERAAKEREAKQKAEERAAKLAAEREAAAERKAGEVAAAKAAAEEKRAAEAAKKAEEAAKKAEAEAAKKAETAEAALAATAPVGGGKECPKGMTLIDGGAFMMGAPNNDPERNFGDQPYASVDVKAFCVDYYEFPNRRDSVPSEQVSFKNAQAQCKAKNKRLCTEPEWEKACKGPSGSRFPYGNQWDPTACATEDDEGNKRQAAKSGEFKRCRSGYNVYDMSGNVAEWTATEYGAGGYVVKGGSADRPGYDGRCAARKKKKATDADALLGFRCCADPK